MTTIVSEIQNTSYKMSDTESFPKPRKGLYHGFAMTYNPTHGISDAEIECLHNHIKEKCTYYTCITEKTGERKHMHAAMFFFKPKRTSNVKLALGRLKFGESTFRPESDKHSQWDKSMKVKVIYNDGWSQNYMDKDDDTVEIGENLPKDLKDLEDYYCPENNMPTGKSLNPWYQKLERMWQATHKPEDEIYFDVVSNFVAKCMFDDRILVVISDPRRMRQQVRALVSYMRRDHTYTYPTKAGRSAEDEPPLKKQRISRMDMARFVRGEVLEDEDVSGPLVS